MNDKEIMKAIIDNLSNPVVFSTSYIRTIVHNVLMQYYGPELHKRDEALDLIVRHLEQSMKMDINDMKDTLKRKRA